VTKWVWAATVELDGEDAPLVKINLAHVHEIKVRPDNSDPYNECYHVCANTERHTYRLVTVATQDEARSFVDGLTD